MPLTIPVGRRLKAGARRRKALTKESEDKMGQANFLYAMGQCVHLRIWKP